MQQTLATSATAISAHSHENNILTDMERLLDERPSAKTVVSAATPRARRLAPLVLLAGVGAALALMPASVKDALMTGRSVAHSPDR